jgi:divalent metal cation (Fe/Co/Zn/Cd) transporter
VLFEDTAALTGLAIAFVAITAAYHLDMPELDGIGSIGIGLVLAVSAVLLARESKGLLIGEAALPDVQARILALASGDEAVHRVNGLVTTHIGPEDIVAALSIEFEDRLRVPELEKCVERLEDAIRAEVPEIRSVFIKPQTRRDWEAEPLPVGEPVE